MLNVAGSSVSVPHQQAYPTLTGGPKTQLPGLLELLRPNKCQIQTHKRFETTLFIRTKHIMQIFGAILFIKLQNDT